MNSFIFKILRKIHEFSTFETMEEVCKSNNIKYLNLDNQSIGLNGIVRDEFKNKDLSDHHYDIDKHTNLIIKNLRNYL